MLDFLEDQFGGPSNLPVRLDPPGEVDITIDPQGQAAIFIVNDLDNDSLMLSKAATTAEIGVGYSRRVWPTARGSLYLGTGGEVLSYAIIANRCAARRHYGFG